MKDNVSVLDFTHAVKGMGIGKSPKSSWQNAVNIGIGLEECIDILFYGVC